jgi:hypothetical protein
MRQKMRITTFEQEEKLEKLFDIKFDDEVIDDSPVF